AKAARDQGAGKREAAQPIGYDPNSVDRGDTNSGEPSFAQVMEAVLVLVIKDDADDVAAIEGSKRCIDRQRNQRRSKGRKHRTKTPYTCAPPNSDNEQLPPLWWVRIWSNACQNWEHHGCCK